VRACSGFDSDLTPVNEPESDTTHSSAAIADAGIEEREEEKEVRPRRRF
jgi:hypothetical protein